MRPAEHKKKHDWMLSQLLQIDDDDVRLVCRNAVQYIKDLQVMDMYRYHTEYLSLPSTFEIIDGAKRAGPARFGALPGGECPLHTWLARHADAFEWRALANFEAFQLPRLAWRAPLAALSTLLGSH